MFLLQDLEKWQEKKQMNGRDENDEDERQTTGKRKAQAIHQIGKVAGILQSLAKVNIYHILWLEQTVNAALWYYSSAEKAEYR